MQIAGISHRPPTAEESERVDLVEKWLVERRIGLDLSRAYVHAKTASVQSGTLELHLPFVHEPELVLVVELDVSSDSLSLHWAVETHGPGWPAWTAGTHPWSGWMSAMDTELRRRVRVTASRFGAAKRFEVEASPEAWVPVQAGRLLGRRETHAFALLV